MTRAERQASVQTARTAELLRLQRVNRNQYQQTRKNYNKTIEYTHLTFDERREAVKELAECISSWGEARLFAECIDKIHFNPAKTATTIVDQAFEQIVSRFEPFLVTRSSFGLLIHDNNETVAKRHTAMMKRFLRTGTLWTGIKHIIDTPMFVDSQLTSMVQMADICGYALRRYLENQETELFDLVFQRADKVVNTAVGVRHFTKDDCRCKICSTHRY